MHHRFQDFHNELNILTPPVKIHLSQVPLNYQILFLSLDLLQIPHLQPRLAQSKLILILQKKVLRHLKLGNRGQCYQKKQRPTSGEVQPNFTPHLI